MTANRPLRFGFKTAPQHTTYEEMLAVWQAADAAPDLRARLALRPLQPDRGRRRRALPGGLDPAGRPRRQDRAAAPRPDGRRQHLPPPGRRTPTWPRRRRHLAAAGSISGSAPAGTSTSTRAWASRSTPPGERIRRLGEACEITKRLFTEDVVDLRRPLLPAQGGALRAEAGAEALPALRDRRQRRAADPARRGAVRRRLELRRRRRRDLHAQGPGAARALRRHRPRPERDRALGPVARRLRRSGRRAAASCSATSTPAPPT